MKSESTRFALLPCIAAGLLAIVPASRASAQMPPANQVQDMLQNPQMAEMLRQRLQQSGMTADQVRARLKAAGYPDTLLNSFLGGSGGAAPGAMQIQAMQALGVMPAAVEYLPVDTGMIVRGDPIPAESIAAGNYVFGVDLFRRSRSLFLPLLAGPVPPDYRLGPGDEIVLILTGDVELAYTLSVTREGFILIPQVGQVFVSNLTFDQLQDLLYSRLGRVYSGVRRGAGATARFSVSVANVRANQVFVIGEVLQPGAVQISALGTVLTGLYAAGGVTSRANLRHIEVRRLGKVVDSLDLYDYLLRGDDRNDIRLETGDVVFVPVHGPRARVTGAVRRPAIYELREWETLSDLLRASGGFKPDAALRRLAVHRFLPPATRSMATPARAVIDVPLGADPPARGKQHAAAGDGTSIGGVIVPGLGLEDGDSVVVDYLPAQWGEYFVTIAGMVQKPSQLPWSKGMTLRDALLLARGPLVGADLREAEIARMPADRTSGQLATTIRVPLDSSYLYNRDSTGQYFGPPGLPFPGTNTPETELEPYDNILILKQPEFDYQRTVVVVGQVKYPGSYSLRNKTERLADIIARANGLTTQAYPEGIRFVRQVGEVGRINVDLPRALKEPTSLYNIILQPGDSIEIPEYQPAVKVTGAVNSPGSVLWQKGKPLDYYINAAGGFSYKADKDRVSVRYANGAVRTRHRSLLKASDPKPGPGSEVMVPEKNPVQQNWIAMAGAVTGILTSLIAMVVLLQQL